MDVASKRQANALESIPRRCIEIAILYRVPNTGLQVRKPKIEKVGGEVETGVSKGGKVNKEGIVYTKTQCRDKL